MDNRIIPISCNICQKKLSSGYRTSCQHLLCTQCASDAFTTGISCPTCYNVLSKSEVFSISEIDNIEGIDLINDLTSRMFDVTLSAACWKDALTNINKSLDAFKDVTSFCATQLSNDAEKMQQLNAELVSDITNVKEQYAALHIEHNQYIINVEKKISDYEERLGFKEKELNEFKAAYKEKLRKCQAWEKAYNSLRSQMHNDSMKSAQISSASNAPTELTDVDTSYEKTVPRDISRYTYEQYPVAQNPWARSRTESRYVRRDVKASFNPPQSQSYKRGTIPMYDKASSGFSATIPVPRDKVNPNVYRSSIFSNQEDLPNYLPQKREASVRQSGSPMFFEA